MLVLLHLGIKVNGKRALEEETLKISVIGLGYIGLPTALMIASRGYETIGVDYSDKIVSSLQNGEVTFDEKGLAELFAAACAQNITFTSKYPQADIYIVAVPTPYVAQSKEIDPTYVINAVSSILEACKKEAIIVIESTTSPGTIDKHIRPLIEKSLLGGGTLHLVHAPERIIPGNMLYELEHNDRTIGADTPEIARRIKEVYSSFCKGEIILTDIKSAEMSKVVENTFRDVNIAFANELAKICKEDGLDVNEIIRIANHHPRVNILQPGPGVGGHCISVDPWFLVGKYPFTTKLISAARNINSSMPEYVLERVYILCRKNGIKDTSRVGFYGLTYKENVDDVRESPTLQLVECMQKHLASGSASAGSKFYDPYVVDDIVPNQLHSLQEFLASVDLVVVMVAHKELLQNKELLCDKVIFDTRNCIQGSNVERL